VLIFAFVKTPDDGYGNCPKHVEFYSKDQFEKFVRLIGFIIRIYHDARSPERQKSYLSLSQGCCSRVFCSRILHHVIC